MGCGIFILFLIFTLGVGNTSAVHKKWSWIAAGLIIIYGTGEGLGSGLFPYNRLHGSLTLMGKLHTVSSAVGVFAPAILPLIADKMFQQEYKFKRYARYIFFRAVSGVTFFSLQA